MFKTVMVPVNGVAADALALDTALAVARRCTAHLHCVRVRLSSASLVWEGELLDVVGGVLNGDLVKSLEVKATERSARARDTFDKFCARETIPVLNTPPEKPSVSAAWEELAGNQIGSLIAQAHRHDLVVVARGVLDETNPTGDLTVEMIMRSGRPVLLARNAVPPRFGDRVALAWKDSAEAARAVTGAMPLLEQARQVDVISADEGDNGPACAASAAALASALRWHGIATHRHVVAPKQGGAAQAVLEQAGACGASLLVMGGYGHHRTDEIIFGGFTQDVLDHCLLPVLFFH